MLIKNIIINGDCLENIPTIPDDYLDCILTDPPYGISKESNLHTLKNPRSGIDFGTWDTYSDNWLDLVKSKLKIGANVIIFNSWQNLGFLSEKMLKNDIEPKRVLYYKRTNPFPINRDRLPVNIMDSILWGVYKNTKWTFNRRSDKPYETGIFEYPVQKKSLHPTPKPVGLIKELLEVFTNKNDMVLDPFSGSGTLAVAAKECSRNFICIEKEKTYYDLSVERLKDE